MKNVVALVLSLLAIGSSSARERPIISCDQAPLLAEYQKQLPDHVLASAADTQPQLLSKLPRVAISILSRSKSRLVCVVIALDATGKSQTLAVSYPAGFALTDNERDQILATQWSAAQVAGRARPSLVNMDFELR